MEFARFGDNKTGQLIRISMPEDDWAFIPDPLPPSWSFPIELWPLLSKAKEGLAKLDGIGRTLESPDLLLRPLQRREAIRSSKLEGTFASPQELLLFELRSKNPSSDTESMSDQREVYNYGRALTEGVELLKKIPLSLRLIREVHKTLLSGVRGRERNPGQFRRHPVHIDTDRRFIPPPPNVVNECLDRFEKHIHEQDSRFDPLVRAFLLHYQFEAIHPFSDGNGRVGRVLLSLMVYRWCNMTMPWLYISPFFERNKDEYINRLFGVSADGAWHEWIEFCLRATIEESEDAVRRCDALIELRREYHATAGLASPRTHPIIDLLFVSPAITIPLMAKKFSVRYLTAKADLDKLVSFGILEELEDVRPKVFYAPRIVSIAFGDGKQPGEESKG